MVEPHQQRSSSWGRGAGIVAVFVLLGPLVGTFGTNLLLALMDAIVAVTAGGARGFFPELIGGTVIGTIVFLPIAYSVGLVSAAGIGIAVAIGQGRGHGLSWWITLLAAVVFSLAMAAFMGLTAPPGRLPTVGWYAGILLAHVLGATLCTALARLLFAAR